MKTCLAALLLLLLPPASHAAFTSARDLGTRTVTVTGDDSAEVLVVGVTSNQFTHNLSGGGFHSPADWDTTQADTQPVFVDPDPNTQFAFVVNSGGGDDAVTVTTAASTGLKG